MGRVLLVGKGAPDRGGIPSFLHDLRTGELSQLHELTFLNLAHTGVPEAGRWSITNVGRTLHDAWAVWRAAPGHDVVHLHSALAPATTVLRAGLLVVAGRLRGCAVVVHAHGGNIETWLLGRPARLLTRLAMAPAQLVVAVWTEGHRVLTGALGPRRVRYVANGVDATRFSPRARTPDGDAASGPPQVLYVGLLTGRKGVLDLLEASRMLREQGVDHELSLLGGVPDEGPEAAEPVLAAAGSATLLGTRAPEEMPDVYRAADVFCLPSWWEAMPLSVLEAMASGLPVVATEVGDVPRLVVHGGSGLVVPPQRPDLLAEALRRLLEDPSAVRSYGRAGRARVEEAYSSSVTAHAISELYAEALSGGRR